MPPIEVELSINQLWNHSSSSDTFFHWEWHNKKIHHPISCKIFFYVYEHFLVFLHESFDISPRFSARKRECSTKSIISKKSLFCTAIAYCVRCLRFDVNPSLLRYRNKTVSNTQRVDHNLCLNDTLHLGCVSAHSLHL